VNSVWEKNETSTLAKYREFGKSLCTRLQCIVIAHVGLMN